MQALLGRWGPACLLATWLEEPPWSLDSRRDSYSFTLQPPAPGERHSLEKIPSCTSLPDCPFLLLGRPGPVSLILQEHASLSADGTERQVPISEDLGAGVKGVDIAKPLGSLGREVDRV